MRNFRTKGITLIELIVTLTILSLFLVMLLPAVQAARETARRANCQSNLKKLTNAMLELQRTHDTFPTHGWGVMWMPDPNMGIGLKQPGGWGYQILPFLGEEEIYLKGAGKSHAEKCKLNRIRVETPLPFWNCPTRREAKTYPVRQSIGRNAVSEPYWCEKLTISIRTDYAVNGGDEKQLLGMGPWPRGEDIEVIYEKYEFPSNFKKYHGISWPQSEVAPRDITDGMSNTYLIGEKSINPAFILKGLSLGDDQSPYSGDDMDCIRWAEPNCSPIRDTLGAEMRCRFGSSHPEGFNMSFCDGSVTAISYKIDTKVHQQLANRHDGSGTKRPK